ncbi:MAG TPA: Uma2 family endonuclease [Bryobacteraceae bacterium]|nr:Uma2 family endonuclease [Bryobacteraceae bacterium]
MAVETKLVTVSEFLALPDPPDGRYELRDGELVLAPPVKRLHTRIQLALVKLLTERLAAYGEVGMEYPFQPTEDFHFRYADVAFVARHRANATPDDAYLQGAPDIVIEILSPSNTADELEEKRLLCLTHGCRSFWTVNPKLSTVEVTEPDFTSRLYRENEIIPLPEGATLRVSDIFARP